MHENPEPAADTTATVDVDWARLRLLRISWHTSPADRRAERLALVAALCPDAATARREVANAEHLAATAVAVDAALCPASAPPDRTLADGELSDAERLAAVAVGVKVADMIRARRGAAAADDGDPWQEPVAQARVDRAAVDACLARGVPVAVVGYQLARIAEHERAVRESWATDLRRAALDALDAARARWDARCRA